MQSEGIPEGEICFRHMCAGRSGGRAGVQGRGSGFRTSLRGGRIWFATILYTFRKPEIWYGVWRAPLRRRRANRWQVAGSDGAESSKSNCEEQGHKMWKPFFRSTPPLHPSTTPSLRRSIAAASRFGSPRFRSGRGAPAFRRTSDGIGLPRRGRPPHPRRFAIGAKEADTARRPRREDEAAKLERYLRRRLRRGCRPGGVPYLLDHHHLALVLAKTASASRCTRHIRENWRRAVRAGVWTRMKERNWLALRRERARPARSCHPAAVGDRPARRPLPQSGLGGAPAGGLPRQRRAFRRLRWADFFRTRVKSVRPGRLRPRRRGGAETGARAGGEGSARLPGAVRDKSGFRVRGSGSGRSDQLPVISHQASGVMECRSAGLLQDGAIRFVPSPALAAGFRSVGTRARRRRRSGALQHGNQNRGTRTAIRNPVSTAIFRRQSAPRPRLNPDTAEPWFRYSGQWKTAVTCRIGVEAFKHGSCARLFFQHSRSGRPLKPSGMWILRGKRRCVRGAVPRSSLFHVHAQALSRFQPLRSAHDAHDVAMHDASAAPTRSVGETASGPGVVVRRRAVSILDPTGRAPPRTAARPGMTVILTWF